MNLQTVQEVQNIGIEKERLLSLIDFAQQAALLRSAAVAETAFHGGGLSFY